MAKIFTIPTLIETTRNDLFKNIGYNPNDKTTSVLNESDVIDEESQKYAKKVAAYLNKIQHSVSSSDTKKMEETRVDRYETLIQCIDIYERSTDELFKKVVAEELNNAIRKMNRELIPVTANTALITQIENSMDAGKPSSDSMIDLFHKFEDLSSESKTITFPYLREIYNKYKANEPDSDSKNEVIKQYNDLNKPYTSFSNFELSRPKIDDLTVNVETNRLVKRIDNVDPFVTSMGTLRNINESYMTITRGQIDGVERALLFESYSDLLEGYIDKHPRSSMAIELLNTTRQDYCTRINNEMFTDNANSLFATSIANRNIKVDDARELLELYNQSSESEKIIMYPLAKASINSFNNIRIDLVETNEVNNIITFEDLMNRLEKINGENIDSEVVNNINNLTSIISAVEYYKVNDIDDADKQKMTKEYERFITHYLDNGSILSEDQKENINNVLSGKSSTPYTGINSRNKEYRSYILACTTAMQAREEAIFEHDCKCLKNGIALYKYASNVRSMEQLAKLYNMYRDTPDGSHKYCAGQIAKRTAEMYDSANPDANLCLNIKDGPLSRMAIVDKVISPYGVICHYDNHPEPFVYIDSTGSSISNMEIDKNTVSGINRSTKVKDELIDSSILNGNIQFTTESKKQIELIIPEDVEKCFGITDGGTHTYNLLNIQSNGLNGSFVTIMDPESKNEFIIESSISPSIIYQKIACDVVISDEDCNISYPDKIKEQIVKNALNEQKTQIEKDNIIVSSIKEINEAYQPYGLTNKNGKIALVYEENETVKYAPIANISKSDNGTTIINVYMEEEHVFQNFELDNKYEELIVIASKYAINVSEENKSEIKIDNIEIDKTDNTIAVSIDGKQEQLLSIKNNDDHIVINTSSDGKCNAYEIPAEHDANVDEMYHEITKQIAQLDGVVSYNENASTSERIIVGENGTTRNVFSINSEIEASTHATTNVINGDNVHITIENDGRTLKLDNTTFDVSSIAIETDNNGLIKMTALSENGKDVTFNIIQNIQPDTIKNILSASADLQPADIVNVFNDQFAKECGVFEGAKHILSENDITRARVIQYDEEHKKVIEMRCVIDGETVTINNPLIRKNGDSYSVIHDGERRMIASVSIGHFTKIKDAAIELNDLDKFREEHLNKIFVIKENDNDQVGCLYTAEKNDHGAIVLRKVGSQLMNETFKDTYYSLMDLSDKCYSEVEVSASTMKEIKDNHYSFGSIDNVYKTISCGLEYHVSTNSVGNGNEYDFMREKTTDKSSFELPEVEPQNPSLANEKSSASADESLSIF